MSPLEELIHHRHILVCCGPGGVGKTTTSAALALRAADEGRRVIVCTIDPARRLAQSMGLGALSSEPTRVPDAAFKGRKPRGQLYGMMLDMKRTFDGMILDMTTPERAERIFANPFYKHVSSTLAGTQEYMAMEKLYELHEEGQWELIVIDTPPTRSALDFLDAPRRLTDFFDSRFLRILLWPYVQAGRGTFRAMNFGARAVLRAATRITGSELLADVANFFQAFEGMYGTFKSRADRVRELLGAKRTAFVVVASPQEASLREARYFIGRLQRDAIPLGGVIVNRTHAVPAVAGLEDAAELARRVRGAVKDSLLAAALESYSAWRAVALREEREIAAALGGIEATAVWRIPDFADDVHDIPALRRVGATLVNGEPDSS
jgi:anion-transporting  ArsA/GET3 family ATPase